MHCEVAGDFAGIRAILFHPPALKRDLRKAGDIKQLAAQMVITFRYPGVDAPNFDRYLNRGLFGVLAVDVDCAAELREFAVRGAEHMANFERDG